jgi:hypothetical protein
MSDRRCDQLAQDRVRRHQGGRRAPLLFSPLPVAECHPALVADPRPALQLVIVQRESLTPAGEDQHSGADQLMADVIGRAGVPTPR